MSPRSIRREAERKARKLVRKEALQRTAEPVCHNQDTPEPNPDREDTRGQATGPKTAEGKAISCMNALKTGLTGRSVLLPTDDASAYQAHVTGCEHEFQPAGMRECTLVQSVADADWRLLRIQSLEMAIYARGRSEFASRFEEEEPASRPALLDLETFLAYEKQLRNLHIQEGRLRRQREKDLAELRTAREARLQTASASTLLTAEEAALLSEPKTDDNEAALFSEPKTNEAAFEFSTRDIEGFLQNLGTPNAAGAALEEAQPLMNAA